MEVRTLGGSAAPEIPDTSVSMRPPGGRHSRTVGISRASDSATKGPEIPDSFGGLPSGRPGPDRLGSGASFPGRLEVEADGLKGKYGRTQRERRTHPGGLPDGWLRKLLIVLGFPGAKVLNLRIFESL
jgi:hypothetical protein